MTGLTNLDRTRIPVNVLVFDADGAYHTRYVERVLDRTHDDPERMARELASAMRRTAYFADGMTLVCHDERLPEPIMLRKQSQSSRT